MLRFGDMNLNTALLIAILVLLVLHMAGVTIG